LIDLKHSKIKGENKNYKLDFKMAANPPLA